MRKGVRKLHKKGDSTILLIIKLKYFFLIQFDEMGEACGTHGRDHGYIQNFG